MDKAEYMTEFASPWLFILLPLPIIIRLLSKQSSGTGGTPIITPFFKDVIKIKNASLFSGFNKKKLLKTLAALSWLFLVISVARPRWIGEPMPVEVEGREMLVAIDVSGSMRIADFVLNGNPIERMTVVREVAAQFIEKRCGDKIGLIFFGSRAYLLSPPSFDCQTVHGFMKDAEIGVAGTNTAIGDAIAMAIKYTKNIHGDKVLVLLTDGASNSGYVTPEDAAALAVDKGLKIYTIGVGSKDGGQANFLGLTINNSANEVDEETLKYIAKKTGGKFYLAKDTRGLRNIYDEIDKAEPITETNNTIRPVKELFYIPLLVSLALAFTVFLVLISSHLVKMEIKPND